MLNIVMREQRRGLRSGVTNWASTLPCLARMHGPRDKSYHLKLEGASALDLHPSESHAAWLCSAGVAAPCTHPSS